MPPTHSQIGKIEEIRLESGGYVVIVGATGTEILRVTDTGSAVRINGVAIDPATLDELATLNGLTATPAELNTTSGATARKSWTAAPAGAGTNQGTGTALTADANAVTGADGTVGVVLPTATATSVVTVVNTSPTALLKVYPATGAQINALGANAAFALAAGETAVFVGRSATLWYTAAEGALNDVHGVAAGYKVARGVHTQAAASDTVVTGLTTVVAVVAQFSSAPTVKQLHVSATIGDQAGTPAAGSILIRTYKPTSSTNDATPTAATDFTDNLGIAWVAVGV